MAAHSAYGGGPALRSGRTRHHTSDMCWAASGARWSSCHAHIIAPLSPPPELSGQNHRHRLAGCGDWRTRLSSSTGPRTTAGRPYGQSRDRPPQPGRPEAGIAHTGDAVSGTPAAPYASERRSPADGPCLAPAPSCAGAQGSARRHARWRGTRAARMGEGPRGARASRASTPSRATLHRVPPRATLRT